MDTNTKKNHAYQIFLSYAREDNSKVQWLYWELTKIGYNCWMDTENILPGENWKNSIKSAIKNSTFFLACLSNKSVNKRGYLQKETRYALDIMEEMLDKDIYLIPVRFEECDIQEKLEVFQWVNLYEKDGLDKLIKAIQEGINRRLKKDYKEDKYNGKDVNLLNPIIIENESKKPSEGTMKDLKGTVRSGYLRRILASSPACMERFVESEKLAYGIFEDPQGRFVPLPYYNEYGIKHCIALESFLDEILSCNVGSQEDFIPNSEESMHLLSGAWIHDIGMMYGIFDGEQSSDLTNNPDYCSKLHNEHDIRTARYILHKWQIECTWSYEEKAILSNICYYHQKKHNIDDFAPAVITGKITGEPVRIKVIASLLRIAYACHVDRTRAPGNLQTLYNSLDMPPNEACYWSKPELISKIRFQQTDGRIVIESLLPNPIDFKLGKFDFEDIIELVRKDIEEGLESVQTVLLSYTNTAFKEVTKEINRLTNLKAHSSKWCLGLWPFFLKKPYSSTEGAASLAQMILFEIDETTHLGEDCKKRIKGMIGEVIRWRPYDAIVFKLQNEIHKIISQEQIGSSIRERLRIYLEEFLKNIYIKCSNMTEKAINLIDPNDFLFLYGYSINIVKLIESIKSHLRVIYVIDCQTFNIHQQFESNENEQIITFLNKNGFKVNFIQLIELSRILDDLGRTNSQRKIILDTHSVLKQNGDYHLLCKKGSKGLCLIGRDGGAEIMAFAETNKFIVIDKKEDIDSVSTQGFSCHPEYTNTGIATGVNNSGIQMDVISKSLVDYLITEEDIF